MQYTYEISFTVTVEANNSDAASDLVCKIELEKADIPFVEVEDGYEFNLIGNTEE